MPGIGDPLSWFCIASLIWCSSPLEKLSRLKLYLDKDLSFVDASTPGFVCRFYQSFVSFDYRAENVVFRALETNVIIPDTSISFKAFEQRNNLLSLLA